MPYYNSFQQYENLHSTCTVMEVCHGNSVIGFEGHFRLKQYVPGKPTKWGIANSSSGYLLKYKIYQWEKEKNENRLLGDQVILEGACGKPNIWL